MSNEMTDARALADHWRTAATECDEKGMPEARHTFVLCADQLDALAARLRGEAAQPAHSSLIKRAEALIDKMEANRSAQGEQQAVAWTCDVLQSDATWKTELSAEEPPRGLYSIRNIRPLYTRPQAAAPAPVAGEAVAYESLDAVESYRIWFESNAAWHQMLPPKPDRNYHFAKAIESHILAALAQDRESQGAAPSAPVGVEGADAEQRARELLAAEYERSGMSGAAFCVRSPSAWVTKETGAVLRAIKAALAQQPASQGATPAPCAFRSLLAEARRQYRDSDAAGDVLAWLDERVLDVDHAASVAVPEVGVDIPWPPLPKCWTGTAVTVEWQEGGSTTREVYTDEQMRVYAQACHEAMLAAAPVAPEREG